METNYAASDTNTAAAAREAWVAELTAAAKAGTVKVAGREVKLYGRRAASVYQNGTVEVCCKPKRGSGYASLWIKAGEELPAIVAA